MRPIYWRANHNTRYFVKYLKLKLYLMNVKFKALLHLFNALFTHIHMHNHLETAFFIAYIQ